ncbi:hypothetical protein EDC04DRAFT_2613426 [Pisolithus marmoratus]|nr:hypothetical protein EDC04DRAFT_2613426 [Pisolithus marmoratus]
MSPGDDSEADVGPTGVTVSSDSEQETGRVPKRGEVAPGRAEDDTPHKTSPAWHASMDRVKFLKSLSIMPWYQELVELVHALPKSAPGMGTKLDMPVWATWAWSAEHFILKVTPATTKCEIWLFSEGLAGCTWIRAFIAGVSELGVERGEDVMGAVGGSDLQVAAEFYADGGRGGRGKWFKGGL